MRPIFPLSLSRVFFALLIVAASLGAPASQPVYAATVVTNCTNAGLQAALDVGGLIQFNCASSPATITITTSLSVSETVPSTTIDGEGKIILQGTTVRLIRQQTWGYVATTLTLKNLTLTGGRASGAGEAANGAAVQSLNRSVSQSYPPTLNVDHVTFIDNDVHVTSFSGNAYDYGGAIFSTGGYVNVTDSSFSGNDARNAAGGAIHILRSSLAITNCTFDSNTAIGDAPANSQGGAIYVDGLWPASPIFTITGSRFSANSAYNSGGAIYVNLYENASQFTVDTSSFVGNAVVGGTGALGGAISGGGTAIGGSTGNPRITITRSLFSNNSAKKSASPFDGSGGALAFAQQAVVSITNATFSGNRAEGSSYNANGGALYMSTPSTTFVLKNNTFANNYAGWVGGAVCADNGAVSNTVFANNSAGNGGNSWNIQQTCASELRDDGNNLQYPPRNNNPNTWNEVTCLKGKSAINQRTLPDFQDAQLAALADNGGPTQTMALGAASPAFDHGNDATCAGNDQRGITRPQSVQCDIGAYELVLALRLAPWLAGKGEPGFTLTVYGAGFTAGSQVLWNGTPLATTVVSGLQLQAAVSAGQLASAGTVAITVSGSSLPAASLIVAEHLSRVYLPLAQR
jgi:hypothetical protein